MIRVSSLALLPALVLAFAAPAFATSLVKGEKLCKEVAQSAEPAPKSIRVDKPNTRASNDRFEMQLRVRNADGSAGVLACSVDRAAGTATVTPIAQ